MKSQDMRRREYNVKQRKRERKSVSDKLGRERDESAHIENLSFVRPE